MEKALRKDREERYQTVKEMSVDLKNLRHELELEAELEHSVQPAASRKTPSLNGALPARRISHNPAASTAEIEEARPTSSAEYIISEIKRHKRGAASADALITTLAAFVG